MTGMSCSFSVLLKGDTFDWIDDAPGARNSFYARCTKISPRRYRDEYGFVHHVGTGKARVHHALPRGSEAPANTSKPAEARNHPAPAGFTRSATVSA